MPNWCQNTLTVQGKEQDVQDFIDMNRDDTASDKDQQILDFNRLVPLPEEFKDPTAGMGWYNWQVANWGTKWNATDTQDWEFSSDADDDFTACTSFDTAWSPPVEWLGNIASRFPELVIKLEYVEHGMGFAGYAVAEEGYFADHTIEYETPDEDDENFYF